MTSTTQIPALERELPDVGRFEPGAPSPSSEPKRTNYKQNALIMLCATLVFIIVLPYVSNDSTVKTAADIGDQYPNSVIVSVREGDTLDAIVDAQFPNTLVEGKGTQEVERFKLEFKRIIVLRSRLASDRVNAGDKLAIPVPPGETGSVSREELPKALTKK